MIMKVIEAKSKKQIKEFIRLPQKLHKNNPCYIPPIWLTENTAYTKQNNPILANSDFIMHLLYDSEDKLIGRNLVYIDHSHNEFYNTQIGFFGAFECVDNKEAFVMLMDAAQK